MIGASGMPVGRQRGTTQVAKSRLTSMMQRVLHPQLLVRLDSAMVTGAAAMRTLLKLVALLVLILWASTAHAQTTRYMSTTGADTGNCTSPTSPCATTAYAFSQMSGGDTLIVGNGTYNQCMNTPPSGTGSGATAYTTIKAETDFGVTLSYGGTACGQAVIHDYSGNYIVYQGFILNGQNPSVDNNNVLAVGTGACCTTNHVKFIRMGVTGGPCIGNSEPIGTNGTDYVLFEDVHVWGCGRYPIILYRSNHTVIRRLVSRFDFNNCAPGDGFGGQTSNITVYDSDNTVIENSIGIDSGIKNGNLATCNYMFGGIWWENHADQLFNGILERTGTVLGSIFLNINSFNNSTNVSTQNPVGVTSRYKLAGNTSTHTEANNVYWDTESGGSYGINGDNCAPSCGNPSLALSHNLYGNSTGTYGGGNEFTLGVGVANACNDPTMGTAGYSCAGSFTSNTFTNSLVMNNNIYGNDGEPGNYNNYWGNRTNYVNTTAGANDKAVNPGLLYLPRIETNSPLHGAASDGGDIGANVIYEYGVSGTGWGDTNYDTLTSTPLWPFPFESQIKSDMSSYSCNAPTCIGGNNPPAVRGFTSTGNGLYGGPITLTSYIWEYLGNPCPSNICNYSQIPQASEPTFSPGAGTYSSAQTVTVSNPSGAPVVCWNTTGTPATNGATGCKTGSILNGTISVSASETLYAVAGGTGYGDSPIVSANYAIGTAVTVAAPTFSLAAGTYSSSQSVAITSSTSGATICYTTNGTTPAASTPGTCSNGTTLANGGMITVSATETVEAMATRSGDINSSMATAAYTINGPVTVATPTFSPAAGTYSSSQSVAITSSTSGATICYTINGTTPAASTQGTCSNGTTLANGGKITVSTSETVEALATLSGGTNSSVASAAYTISASASVTVAVSPGSATMGAGQSMQLTATATGTAAVSSPSFSCSGLPSYGTCQFGSATISSNGQVATSTLTLSVSSQMSSSVQERSAMQLAMAWSGTGGFALFGLVLAGGKRRRKAGALLLAVALFCLVGLQGCAGLVTRPQNQTQPVVFAFTVTGMVHENGTTATNTTTVSITVN